MMQACPPARFLLVHVQVRPFVVAQQYLDNPMLIEGRKFGIRVWVVVASQDPLRVYLHSNGLVLFSGQQYDNASIEDVDGKTAQVRQHL